MRLTWLTVLVVLLWAPPALAQPAPAGDAPPAAEVAPPAPGPGNGEPGPAGEAEPSEPGPGPAAVAPGETAPLEPPGAPVSAAAGDGGEPTLSLKSGEPAPRAGLLLTSTRYADLKKAELEVGDLRVRLKVEAGATLEQKALVDECVEEATNSDAWYASWWAGAVGGAALMGLSILLGVELIE